MFEISPEFLISVQTGIFPVFPRPGSNEIKGIPVYLMGIPIFRLCSCVSVSHVTAVRHIMGKILSQDDSDFIFDWIFIELADNGDRHKIQTNLILARFRLLT